MSSESPVSLLDIKNTLDILCNSVEGLTKSNSEKDAKIDNLLEEVSKLRKILTARDKKIADLKCRITEMEHFTNESKRFSLKNNVIIRGLRIVKPPRSYAAVVNEQQVQDASAAPEPVRTSSSTPATDMFKLVRSQVVEYVQKNLEVAISEEDISAAHELKKGPNDEVALLVVRFVYTMSKQDVMSRTKYLRGKNVYLNDQLTKTNGKIFGRARYLKRMNFIHATWTRLGKVFVKKTEHSSPTWITSLLDLPTVP